MPYRDRARPARTRLLALLTALAAAVGVAAASAAADPKPDPSPNGTGNGVAQRISDVTVQLEHLGEQSAHLDEQYNQAVMRVRSAQAAAHDAQTTAADASARYRIAHDKFVVAVTQQLKDGPGLSAGQLLTSDSPQQYLDSLVLADYLSREFAGTVDATEQLRSDAADARRQAGAALATARKREAALAKQRAALQAQTVQFQNLLDSLTAQQRAEIAQARAAAAARARATLAPPTPPRAKATGRSHRPPVATAPLSSSVPRRLQKVIAFAEAQVGKSYSYAASGPSSYDCSGLTMAAYARVGISLPHSAADQYGYGTHVAYKDLQPGDLIFLYSPIGHVEIYVGHDLAVSAANPATGVVYVHPSDDMGNYVGATRLID